jgi:hypothetical protein
MEEKKHKEQWAFKDTAAQKYRIVYDSRSWKE